MREKKLSWTEFDQIYNQLQHQDMHCARLARSPHRKTAVRDEKQQQQQSWKERYVKWSLKKQINFTHTKSWKEKKNQERQHTWAGLCCSASIHASNRCLLVAGSPLPSIERTLLLLYGSNCLPLLPVDQSVDTVTLIEQVGYVESARARSLNKFLVLLLYTVTQVHAHHQHCCLQQQQQHRYR